jgi:hypothetical protein
MPKFIEAVKIFIPNFLALLKLNEQLASSSSLSTEETSFSTLSILR